MEDEDLDPRLPGGVEVGPDEATPEGLLRLLDAQAATLVAVGTGKLEIDDANPKFKRRRGQLNRGLKLLGIAPPFPYDDLWAWYGHYHLYVKGYVPRRELIASQGRGARAALEAIIDGVAVADPGSAGARTWLALDTRVDGAIVELQRATSSDDLQDVGRRCREILIDAAKIIARAELLPPGVEEPKAGDAKAWLDYYLAAQAGGSRHDDLRNLIRVAWRLMQSVTHGTVDRVDAYAAAQSTVLIVRTLQQIDVEPTLSD